MQTLTLLVAGLGLLLLAGSFDDYLPVSATPPSDAARAGGLRWRTWCPLAALTLLALVLRLYHLTHLSLWLDEGGTIQFSRLPWLAVLGLHGVYDTHPPLYYALVKLISGIVPDLLAARLLSALAGTLTVPVLYLLASRLLPRRGALAAALVLALSPLHIWYSQEARMYAPVVFVVALSYLALVAWHQTTERRWATIYGCSLVVALYLDYSAAYALAPQALVLALTTWRHRRDALLLWSRTLGAGLLFLAWVPQLTRSLTTLGYERASYLGVTPAKVGQSLLSVTGFGGYGSYFFGRLAAPWQRWQAWDDLLLAILLGIVALAALVLIRRRPGLLVAAGLLAGTVACAAGFSLLTPGYADRTVLAATLGWALVVGAAATSERASRWANLAGTAALATTVLASAVTLGAIYGGATKQDYRALVTEATAAAALGRPVVTAGTMREFFDAYAPDTPLASTEVIGKTDALWLAYGDYEWAGLPALRDELAAAGYQRVIHDYIPEPLYLDLYARADTSLGTTLSVGQQFGGADGWQVGKGARVVTEAQEAARLDLVPGGSAILRQPAPAGGLLMLAIEARVEQGAAPLNIELACLDGREAIARSTTWSSLGLPAVGTDRQRATLAVLCPEGTELVRATLRNAGGETVTYQAPRLSLAAPLAGSTPAAPTTGALLARCLSTTGLLVLLVAVIAGVLRLALAPRAATAVALAVLVVGIALAAPALPRPTAVTGAVAVALRSEVLWGTLTWLGLGTLALALARRPAESVRRRWLTLGVYGGVTGGLAAWWAWGGTRENLQAALRARALERVAVDLVPVVIVIGAVALTAAALALRPQPWEAVVRADLGALLVLLAVPLAASAAAGRHPTGVEDAARLSWVAGVLVLLVVARTVVLVFALVRAANCCRVTDRRMAWAIFASCLAVYAAAIGWRGASLRPEGDEPQYLAGTMTLWHNRNLQLADAMFSPEMDAILGNSQSVRDLHIYDDDSRDRLTLSGPAAAGTTLYLPLAGGPDLTTALELVNPGLEAAGVTVVYYDGDGNEADRQTATVEPDQALRLSSRTPADRPVSATVTAGKPVLATLWLSDRRDGVEVYSAALAVPRRCFPVYLGDRPWQAEVVVQNPLPTPAQVSVRRYDAAGRSLGDARLTVPGNGSGTAPLPANPDLGGVCVNGDGPVAGLLVARGAPGLLVQQPGSAQEGRVPIPLPQVVQGHLGASEVLVYNPASDPVTVTFTRDGTEAGSGSGEIVEVPPQGTARFHAERASRDVAHDTGWIVPDGPVVVSILSRVGGHAAALTPRLATARLQLLPVIGAGTPRYSEALLELNNAGEMGSTVTASLRDTTGQVVWQDKIWVCGGCVTTQRFWYRGEVDGVVTLSASEPFGATLLQREVVTARPYHSVGLSLLAVPGYALGGWTGALATVGLVAALLAAGIFGLLRDAGIDRRVAVAVTLLLACSSPLVTYAAQLYPEIVGAALLVIATRLLVAATRGALWKGVFALACLAAVPVFHTRLLPLSLALLGVSTGYLVVRGLRGRQLPAGRQRLWLALLAVVGVASLALVVWLEPRARPDYLRTYLSGAGLLDHLLGILFDGASGLLPSLPILLLASAGFALAYRRVPLLATLVLAVIGVQLLLVATRNGGWETTPPGRYILAAVPFFSLPLAVVWQGGWSRPVRGLAAASIGWGACVASFFSWVPGAIFYSIWPRHWYADNLLDQLVGGNPFWIFPALPWHAPYLGLSPGPWSIATLLAILVLGGLLGRGSRDPASAETAGEPATLQPVARHAEE